MAEKIYSLYSDAEILDQRLAVEIGKNYLVLVAGTTAKVSGLEYFATDEIDLDDILSEISRQSLLIKSNYSETKLFYNLEESVLVPAGQFHSSAASDFVDLAFGNLPASRVNVENVNTAPAIVNVYRSNEKWPDIIANHFRAVTKRHLYSKLVEETTARNMELRVIFYKESFIVIAVKNKQLKIARNFRFTNDADVLYQILNTCRQVDISEAEGLLNISGLVEKKSSMITLLEKYFGAVVTDGVSPEILPAGEDHKYPLHYFTSFINLLS